MSTAFGCVGNTIRLRSGRYLDLKDPRPEQFSMQDIAGGLAKICRFGGQVNEFYSVAEHCLMCELQAHRDGHGKDVCLSVLLHDAAEAFVGDIVKPLKVLLNEYREIEGRLQAVIMLKYGLDPFAHAGIVREIDHAMLIAERKSLFSRDSVLWVGEESVRELCLHFHCMNPISAELSFLEMAKGLGYDRRMDSLA